MSLTNEERAAVCAETRAANPFANAKDFNMQYKLDLWAADVKKKGGKLGANLGNVDLTSLSETDDEEDSGEDSDSSEDGMTAIRNDLERQYQVNPPSSPKENRFLAGFMKPSQRHQQEAQAKQALDKDPISLVSPFEQAANESSSNELGQRTGDVPGQGSSVAVQHGSFR